MKEKTQLAKVKDFCLNSRDKLTKERWMYLNTNSKTIKF